MWLGLSCPTSTRRSSSTSGWACGSPRSRTRHGHVEASLPAGLRFTLDTEESIRSFDPAWAPPSGAHRVAVAFRCESPEDVDRLYRELTEAGAPGYKEPWNAFWGQRYAQVKDPDGSVKSTCSHRSADVSSASPRCSPFGGRGGHLSAAGDFLLRADAGMPGGRWWPPPTVPGRASNAQAIPRMKLTRVVDDIFQLSLLPRGGINAYLVGDVLVDAGLGIHGPRHSLKRSRVEQSAPICSPMPRRSRWRLENGERCSRGSRLVRHRDAEAVPRSSLQAGSTALFNWKPVQVAGALSEGEKLGPGFTMLDTPGHIALWRESDRTLRAHARELLAPAAPSRSRLHRRGVHLGTTQTAPG